LSDGQTPPPPPREGLCHERDAYGVTVAHPTTLLVSHEGRGEERKRHGATAREVTSHLLERWIGVHARHPRGRTTQHRRQTQTVELTSVGRACRRLRLPQRISSPHHHLSGRKLNVRLKSSGLTSRSSALATVWKTTELTKRHGGVSTGECDVRLGKQLGAVTHETPLSAREAGRRFKGGREASAYRRSQHGDNGVDVRHGRDHGEHAERGGGLLRHVLIAAVQRVQQCGRHARQRRLTDALACVPLHTTKKAAAHSSPAPVETRVSAVPGDSRLRRTAGIQGEERGA
jgi:hypothetical protein